MSGGALRWERVDGREGLEVLTGGTIDRGVVLAYVGKSVCEPLLPLSVTREERLKMEARERAAPFHWEVGVGGAPLVWGRAASREAARLSCLAATAAVVALVQMREGMDAARAAEGDES